MTGPGPPRIGRHVIVSTCDGPACAGHDPWDRDGERHTGAVDDERSRPSVVTVMAEHGVEDPLWDRPVGTGDPLDLGVLGVRVELTHRLRAWNAEYTDVALTDGWPRSEDHQRWVEAGLDLALALQDELWDVEVRYWEGSAEDRAVPVRDRRHRRPRRSR